MGIPCLSVWYSFCGIILRIDGWRVRGDLADMDGDQNPLPLESLFVLVERGENLDTGVLFCVWQGARLWDWVARVGERAHPFLP